MIRRTIEILKTKIISVYTGTPCGSVSNCKPYCRILHDGWWSHFACWAIFSSTFIFLELELMDHFIKDLIFNKLLCFMISSIFIFLTLLFIFYKYGLISQVFIIFCLFISCILFTNNFQVLQVLIVINYSFQNLFLYIIPITQ